MNESASADETDSTVQTAVSQLPWRETLYICSSESNKSTERPLPNRNMPA